MQDADAEIRRVKTIIGQIDKLELEFEKVKAIRDKVKHLRNKVDAVDSRLDRSHSGGHGSSTRRR